MAFTKAFQNQKSAPYTVEIFAERDELRITLCNKNERRVAWWWDEDARMMFEHGFFRSGTVKDSVIEYAKYLRLIPQSAYLETT